MIVKCFSILNVANDCDCFPSPPRSLTWPELSHLRNSILVYRPKEYKDCAFPWGVTSLGPRTERKQQQDGRRQQQQSQVGRQQPLPRLQQECLPLGAGVWSRQEALAQAVHPVLSHGMPVSIRYRFLFIVKPNPLSQQTFNIQVPRRGI